MYIGTVFACHPIKAIFNVTVEGKCVNIALSYIITNSVDTALDFALLSLPIPVILKLSLPMREKLGIAASFLADEMIVATGLVRIIMATRSNLSGKLYPLFLKLCFVAADNIWHRS